MSAWVTKGVTVTTLCLCMASAAGQQVGAESSDRRLVSVEWTEVLRTTANHVLEIIAAEGMPKRSLGLMEQRGRVRQDGDVAVLTAWLSYEDQAGSISYKGYVRYEFFDGATMFGALLGDGRAPGDQQGAISLMSGTGRLEGIEGTLTFKAVSPSAIVLDGRYIVTVTGKYSLPNR